MLAASIVVAGSVAVACGGDDSGGAAGGAALADRIAGVLRGDGGAAVVERLDELGVATDVDALVAAASDADTATCPTVDDPAPGDSATCTLALEDAGVEVAVDVEFGDGGSVRIVGVAVAP